MPVCYCRGFLFLPPLCHQSPQLGLTGQLDKAGFRNTCGCEEWGILLRICALSSDRIMPSVSGVCTACHESSYNTQAIHYDSDGSADYGIFQINSRYWCQSPSEPSSNICGIQCSELLTDNIAVDVACAKVVVDNSPNGLGAW
uniref:Glycosyl hydrolases family 22 (GH22) domain-containing protein n=1 Tax=Podarcis muralis TaxID=64176 RepID=A0A670JZJ5_PODMU